jgi:hypothetical protein
MANRLAALKASEDSMEFWGNEDPKCPHCGDDFDVSENEAWEVYGEGEHELTCPSCDLDFTVETRVSYSFSTEDQPDDE